MQVVQAALMAGVLVFGLVVMLLAIRPQTMGTPTPARMLTLFSLVHGAMAVGTWSLAPLLQTALLARARPESGAGVGTAALAAIRSAGLLRLALLEGTALFGLVVCLLAALGGALREQPLYWLNALSALAFLAYAALSFPTRERVETFFAERFGP